MGIVWGLELSPQDKFVLLAFADHADDDGNRVFPSIGMVAWKTGYSERQVQRIVRQLETSEILMPISKASGGRGRTTLYRIDTEKGVTLSPFVRVTTTAGKGDTAVERVTSTTLKGDTAMSPEPSVTASTNHHESPSSGTSSYNEMWAAVQATTHLDKSICAKTIGSTTKKLLKAKYSAAEIGRYYGAGGWWYHQDFRGLKGQPPKLHDIEQTIKLAREQLGPVDLPQDTSMFDGWKGKPQAKGNPM